MKQSRLQAFFIWSFSLEISSFPGWKSHQTTETKSSPTKNKKTRKTKTGNFVSNWNWIFLFFPHSSFAQCGFSFNTAADGGHSPNMSEASGRAPEYSNSRANWYKLIHSSCIELYNSSSTRVSLETTVAPAPAGFFFLRVYKRERERGELSEKIQKHRGDRWMDGWLAGRAKYLASQCLKDGRLTTPSSTCELQGRATITCRVPSVCFPCYFLLLASLALPWWSIARKQVTVTIITTARMRWERPTSTAGRQQ